MSLLEFFCGFSVCFYRAKVNPESYMYCWPPQTQVRAHLPPSPFSRLLLQKIWFSFSHIHIQLFQLHFRTILSKLSEDNFWFWSSLPSEFTVLVYYVVWQQLILLLSADCLWTPQRSPFIEQESPLSIQQTEQSLLEQSNKAFDILFPIVFPRIPPKSSFYLQKLHCSRKK